MSKKDPDSRDERREPAPTRPDGPVTQWDQLSSRPSASSDPAVHLADMATGQPGARVVLAIRDLSLSGLLRRGLLRNGIWCAPARSRGDALNILGTLSFSALVTDLDDEFLEAPQLLAKLPQEHTGLCRIALTRSLGMRKRFCLLAQHTLLLPLDMGELISAVLGAAAAVGPLHPSV